MMAWTSSTVPVFVFEHAEVSADITAEAASLPSQAKKDERPGSVAEIGVPEVVMVVMAREVGEVVVMNEVRVGEESLLKTSAFAILGHTNAAPSAKAKAIAKI